MSGRYPLAVLVGALLMYAWASAVHMSPLARIGVGQFTDPAAANALSVATADKPGLYLFPCLPTQDVAGRKARAAELARTPSGLVI